MGIRTVAVYSEADAGAMHAQLADEAVCIGPSEASLSYLSITQLLEAIKISGSDAVHPGYGFLSERSEFSLACREAGITFVGPSPESMNRLGSKIQAKEVAVQAGVPIVPGYFQPGASELDLREAAEQIGYPVLLKASAGGGGRGMRAVNGSEQFASEFAMATSEAIKAFGDGTMMVEKLIERPRHIEVQILADEHGNVACLFERECSIQRRHQKLIEESPSPLEGYEKLWPRMREASSALILAAGYVGAGTVEFIVDPTDGAFYFLEVNARLQVEHPVTEAVTGVDLVQWQLRIAKGEELQLDRGLMAGDRARQVGHAIEARVVAEDPQKGFLPSTGTILGWQEPSGPGIRVDTGFRSGLAVSSFYDSMLAKVIVHAEDRPSAIRRMISALEDFHVLGIRTNIAFLITVLMSEEFKTGQIDTGLVDRSFQSPTLNAPPAELALLVSCSLATPVSRSDGLSPSRFSGAWGVCDSFRNTNV
jgi:acetyl/propionyl-CoA carboxylase alpha subunit